ncbi:hypothetical protein ABVK25_003263 [Lepraria finkii]|uniref:Uncharacterized protein n=1 Tax=Lepraria finkii TaxID=1340010 RepID=A0ABR4BEF0_9LECA
MNQTQIDDLDTQLALAILEERTERTLLPDSNKIGIKTKSKTRGVADTSSSPSEPEDQQTPPSPIEPIPTPTVKVNKREHRNFLTLFHTPDADDVPGELPWIDFLHTMGSAGFFMKKLDGPAWYFEPGPDMGSKCVIFHEPHPENRIPFQIARRYGRQLCMAYWWTAETFFGE